METSSWKGCDPHRPSKISGRDMAWCFRALPIPVSSKNVFQENHGSLNVPIEHHPTIKYMVYNGYYKVMSNIPKMGHLPTPENGVKNSRRCEIRIDQQQLLQFTKQITRLSEAFFRELRLKHCPCLNGHCSRRFLSNGWMGQCVKRSSVAHITQPQESSAQYLLKSGWNDQKTMVILGDPTRGISLTSLGLSLS